MQKVVNASNEHVISIGAQFSSEADSHLVCFQNEDGNYQTQATSIPGRTRTGRRLFCLFRCSIWIEIKKIVCEIPWHWKIRWLLLSLFSVLYKWVNPGVSLCCQWLGPVLLCSMEPWKPLQASLPNPALLKVKLRLCVKDKHNNVNTSVLIDACSLTGVWICVSDGLMVQIPPETMESLRTALREQTDFHIPCGRNDGGEIRENVTIRWVDWSSPVNTM